MTEQVWYVYMIRADDGSLYTGITTDVSRRFEEHRAGTGAKYFRTRSPQEVVYQETCESRSTASQREMQIKKLNRTAKLALISGSESATPNK